MRSSAQISTKGKGNGFTLLELLIVIAIIAILATILVIVINPVETLRRARDVQRLSDLSSMKTAISLYLTTDPTAKLAPSTNNCTDSTVAPSIYLSAPVTVSLTYDGNAIVGGGTTPGAIDGNGWVPIDMSSLSGGSPLAAWPIDPAQSTTAITELSTTTQTYRYACLNAPLAFEIDAHLESIAYGSDTEGNNKHQTDGGDNAELYETGTNLKVMQ